MSDKTPNADPTVVQGTVIDPPPSVVESPKPSLFQRAKTTVKKHKTTLFAGAGLVALVGVSAAMGRASAPGDSYYCLGEEFNAVPLDDIEPVVELSLDTPVPTDD